MNHTPGALLGPAEIRELAGRLGVRPTKTLGQNFVHDGGTVRKIVRAATLRPARMAGLHHVGGACAIDNYETAGGKNLRKIKEEPLSRLLKNPAVIPGRERSERARNP